MPAPTLKIDHARYILTLDRQRRIIDRQTAACFTPQPSFELKSFELKASN